MNDLPFGTKPGSLLAATLVTLSMHFPAAAQDMSDSNVMTSQGDLVVHAIHHASMTLTWLDTTVLVDPAPAPGAAEGATSPPSTRRFRRPT